jgi:hypothetical protein
MNSIPDCQYDFHAGKYTKLCYAERNKLCRIRIMTTKLKYHVKISSGLKQQAGAGKFQFYALQLTSGLYSPHLKRMLEKWVPSDHRHTSHPTNTLHTEILLMKLKALYPQ